MHIQDCYNCENFFPNFDCRLKLKYVDKPTLTKGYRFRIGHEVYCSSFIKHDVYTQLDLFDL